MENGLFLEQRTRIEKSVYAYSKWPVLTERGHQEACYAFFENMEMSSIQAEKSEAGYDEIQFI